MSQLSFNDICGVKVSSVNLNLAAETIENWIKNRYKTYVCVAPVSTIVECARNSDYMKIVNSAGMVTPDGMSLVWLSKMTGDKTIERTYGPDLLETVCALSAEKGVKPFFYGGTPEILTRLVNRLKEKFPGINIVGSYAPPFRSKAEESTEVLAQMQAAQPDILWIGLGSPKQDFWMRRYRPELSVPVMIGVGAAFDFLSGAKKQAPRWMQRSGLEWLFRLGCEPKRLWRRYLIGNTQFVYYVIKDFLRLGSKKYE